MISCRNDESLVQHCKPHLKGSSAVDRCQRLPWMWELREVPTNRFRIRNPVKVSIPIWDSCEDGSSRYLSKYLAKFTKRKIAAQFEGHSVTRPMKIFKSFWRESSLQHTLIHHWALTQLTFCPRECLGSCTKVVKYQSCKSILVY